MKRSRCRNACVSTNEHGRDRTTVRPNSVYLRRFTYPPVAPKLKCLGRANVSFKAKDTANRPNHNFSTYYFVYTSPQRLLSVIQNHSPNRSIPKKYATIIRYTMLGTLKQTYLPTSIFHIFFLFYIRKTCFQRLFELHKFNLSHKSIKHKCAN